MRRMSEYAPVYALMILLTVAMLVLVAFAF